eukprot:4930887-Pyramimonas_sp.AAC.1
MVLRSWRREAKKVFRTFATFASVSGLELNLAKTVAIPLWEGDPMTIRDNLSRDPAMPQIEWELTSKYL